MKRERKIAFGIAGIVIVAGIAGLALFLGTGSTVGVAFVAVGIPAILVVAGVLHVKGVVTRSGTSATDFKKQRANELGGQLRGVHGRYSQFRSRYPRWDDAQLTEDLDQVVASLREQGVRFDRDAGTYSLGRMQNADIEELDRIDGSLDSLAADAADSFNGFVRSEMSRLSDALDRVESAGLAEREDWPTVPSGDLTDFDALAERLDDARASADSLVDDAAAEVERLADDTGGGGSVDRLVADARSAADEGDYTRAVDAVLDAQNALEDDLSTEYEGTQDDLSTLFDTVESSTVDEYVSRDRLDEFADLQSEFAALDSALEMNRLERVRSSLRDTCRGMISDMADDLADNVETLEGADAPAGFYERPDAADQNYAAALAETGSIEAFRRTWMTAVGELAIAIDDTETLATAVESYPDIEETIDDRFRGSEAVAAGDLPVKRAEPFMELYAARHPEVTHEPGSSRLVKTEPDETYDLTVFAEFPDGGERRRATVEVEGVAYDGSEDVETYVADEVTFGGVPAGEYEVRAVPDPQDYRTAAAAVTVDGDSRVELTMAEVGLFEQLCEGREAEVREALPTVEDELAARLERDGALSTGDRYPVTEDYVPCLLALWAEQTGHAIVQTDDGAVVYDEDWLETVVERVMSVNVDPGGPKRIDEIRENFLSAPIPEEVIVETAEAFADDYGVTVTDTEIRKEDTE
ncbi:MAG: hypothetical protein ABEJ22_01690 [Haloferacaceae archaeon]